MLYSILFYYIELYYTILYYIYIFIIKQYIYMYPISSMLGMGIAPVVSYGPKCSTQDGDGWGWMGWVNLDDYIDTLW